MADDKEIKITFNTTADTSGAEQASEALKKVAEAAAGATTQETPQAAKAMEIIDERATAAAKAVDKLRKAAEEAGPLTELQKLEFELQRITAEAKVLDAALSKIQSGELPLSGNAAASIENRVNQADLQAEMLAPQIEALQATEAQNQADTAAAEAKAKLAAETKALADVEKARLREQREADQAENVRQIKAAQMGQLTAQLANQISATGRAFSAAGKDVASYDSDQGELLQTIGDVMDRSGKAASAIATGFARGGPAGAAVGAMVAIFNEMAAGAAEAAAVGQAWAGKVEVEWKATAESIKAATASVDSYKRAIEETNEARQEALRQIEMEVQLNQKLRSSALRRAGKKDEADIADIENDDTLSEEKKASRIQGIKAASLRREQIEREQIEREKLASDQRKLQDLRRSEEDAARAKARAEKEAAEFSPEAVARGKAEVEDVRARQKEAQAQLAAKVKRGASGALSGGMFGDLAPVRGAFKNAVEIAKDDRSTPEGLAQAVLDAAKKAQETNPDGVTASRIQDVVNMAENVLATVQAGSDKTAQLDAINRKAEAAAKNLEAINAEYEAARKLRNAEDDGLSASIASRQNDIANLPAEQSDEQRALASRARRQIEDAAKKDAAKAEAERKKQEAEKKKKDEDEKRDQAAKLETPAATARAIQSGDEAFKLIRNRDAPEAQAVRKATNALRDGLDPGEAGAFAAAMEQLNAVVMLNAQVTAENKSKLASALKDAMNLKAKVDQILKGGGK